MSSFGRPQATWKVQEAILGNRGTSARDLDIEHFGFAGVLLLAAAGFFSRRHGEGETIDFLFELAEVFAYCRIHELLVRADTSERFGRVETRPQIHGHPIANLLCRLWPAGSAARAPLFRLHVPHYLSKKYYCYLYQE